MLGILPKSLEVNGIDYPINSDFKIGLLAIQVFNDKELKDSEKEFLILDMYFGIENLNPNDYEEAMKKIAWFIDGGKEIHSQQSKKKLMDWEQDESMIFSAINKVAGKEVREEKYIHWWTFLGYFNEVGEGLFSSIIHLRTKMANGEKLTKEEKDFVKKNKDMVNLRDRYSEEEQEEIDRLNKLLG